MNNFSHRCSYTADLVWIGKKPKFSDNDSSVFSSGKSCNGDEDDCNYESDEYTTEGDESTDEEDNSGDSYDDENESK
jgi:hypothetical protein